MRYFFVNACILAALFLSFLVTCAQPSRGQFTFSGYVDDMPSGWVYIAFIKEKPPFLDSAVVKNGKFEYTTSLAQKEYFNFSFKSEGVPENNFALMYLPAEPGKSITFRGEIDKPSYWKLSGSASVNLLMTLHTKIQDLDGKYRSILNKYKPKFQIPQKEVQELISNTRKRNRLTYQFIDANSPSDASLLAILYSLNTTVPQADPDNSKELAMRLGKTLNDGNRHSLLAQSLESTFDEIGKNTMTVAPDFTQNDVNGKPVSLNSFKGKYVLLDFWASWCVPCRKENPNVVAAYQKYKDKGFDIVGISLDKSRGAWLKAIKQDNLTWTHLSDLKGWQNSIAQLYKVRGIPTNFLLDPQGKIIQSNLRGEMLHQVLQSVFD